MIMLAILFFSAALSCNVVTSWNNVALNAIRKVKLTPPVASRTLAIFNVAVYDATSSIDTQFQPYKYNVATNQSAVIEAAVVAAARKSLSLLFPDQVETFTKFFNDDIAKFNASVSLENGIYIGTKVAENVFNDRLSDGSQVQAVYNGSDLPGKWRPTSVKYAAAEVPQWANMKTWCMPQHDSFRPPAPPTLNSKEYIDDHNQIYYLGVLNDSTRTADQTEIAAFWFDGPATDTPPGTWAVEAGDQICARHFSITESARLFAMISVALADSAIMGWDAKYLYGEWRPITAIRFANTSSVSSLLFNPDWVPLLNTPNWPDFPSDRAMFGGAASRVLGHYFGHTTPLTVDADDLNISRAFPNFAAAAFEQAQSRVYAGSHFNHSVVAGLEYGGRVGDFVYTNCFQPTAPARPIVTTMAWATTILGSSSDNTLNVVKIAVPIATILLLLILVGVTVWCTMHNRRRNFRGDV